MPEFAAARRNMVESQLRPNRIYHEALLDSMGGLPRELFLPASLRGIAYVDEDIALPGGRFLIEPLALARLIQLAEPTKSDRALDIGCGTGYSTAVLARLCHDAVAVETDRAMTEAIAVRLKQLEIRNAWAVEGPLGGGYPPRSPYDVILLGGAVETVPAALTDQLAEGGRLTTVLRAPGGIGRITLIERLGGVLSSRSVADAATRPLPGFARPPEFVF